MLFHLQPWPCTYVQTRVNVLFVLRNENVSGDFADRKKKEKKIWQKNFQKKKIMP